MKYNCSIDEVLTSGYVVKVEGVPSWLDNLLGRSLDEKYVVCRDERDIICVQKVGEKKVFQLFDKVGNGVWCREIRRGEVGPSYRASACLAEVYSFAAKQYAANFIDDLEEILLEEIE